MPVSSAVEGATGLITSPCHTDTPLILAQNLHRIVGQSEAANHILRGVNLRIERREYVSIVGASGSGKSTLLYLLGGLDRPSRIDEKGRPFDPPSRVLIDGQDTSQLAETDLALLRNEKVGFIFQFHYLLKEFTAQENVALPMLKLAKRSRSESMDRAAALLTQLGLSDKLARRTNKLSGGEQQRVAVARALAGQPEAVLADEPTSNLDPAMGQALLAILHELHSEGKTILVSSHDPQVIAVATCVHELEGGKLKPSNNRAC
jgi:lipoprotein-releasing system ATP-binding protein